MLWWVVAALVAAPLVLVAGLAVWLRDRVAELRRVQELAHERAQTLAGRVRDRTATLGPRAARLAERALATRARAAELTGRGSGKLSRYP